MYSTHLTGAEDTSGLEICFQILLGHLYFIRQDKVPSDSEDRQPWAKDSKKAHNLVCLQSRTTKLDKADHTKEK